MVCESQRPVEGASQCRESGEKGPTCRTCGLQNYLGNRSECIAPSSPTEITFNMSKCDRQASSFQERTSQTTGSALICRGSSLLARFRTLTQPKVATNPSKPPHPPAQPSFPRALHCSATLVHSKDNPPSDLSSRTNNSCPKHSNTRASTSRFARLF
jgi:hypothetical protein